MTTYLMMIELMDAAADFCCRILSSIYDKVR